MITKWRRAVRHYIKLLHQEVWDVSCVQLHLDSGMFASATRCIGSHQAVLALRTTYPNVVGFPDTLDEIAAHEVLHLLFDDVERICIDESRITLALWERMLSDVANVLARLSPSGAS